MQSTFDKSDFMGLQNCVEYIELFLHVFRYIGKKPN